MVDVVQGYPTDVGDCDPNPPFKEGNYILIKHGSRYSLYYHLQKDGSFVSFGEKVAPGQLIGLAGNSGSSCGAHLHYQLTSSLDHSGDAAYSFDPEGNWTTDPGRVPWLAKYVSQTTTGYYSIPQGCTRQYEIILKNKGGRNWNQVNDPEEPEALGTERRVYLGPSDSAGNDPRASNFEAGDWTDAETVDEADQVKVLPDNNGTFSFGLQAGMPLGNYTEHFNLWAAVKNPPPGPPDDRWFRLKDSSGVDINIVDVKITVAAPHTC